MVQVCSLVDGDKVTQWTDSEWPTALLGVAGCNGLVIMPIASLKDLLLIKGPQLDRSQKTIFTRRPTWGDRRKGKQGVVPGIQTDSDATGPGETEPAGEACPVGSSSNGYRGTQRPGARPAGTGRRAGVRRQTDAASRTDTAEPTKHASEAPDRPEATLLRQVPEQPPRTGSASDLPQPTQWLVTSLPSPSEVRRCRPPWLASPEPEPGSPGTA